MSKTRVGSDILCVFFFFVAKPITTSVIDRSGTIRAPVTIGKSGAQIAQAAYERSIDRACELSKQAPSYASPKLSPTHSLTGVKCRAISVAKK